MIVPLNNGITTSILDRDAREFIRVAGISDETQIRAINELCKDLKRENFWSSFWRCYPFVFSGITASMLVCLKTRESLLLTYPNGVSSVTTPNSLTFSNTGVQFGYTSSIAIPISILPITEVYRGGHISIYNRAATNLPFKQSHGGNGNLGIQRFTGTFLTFGTASGGVGNIFGSFYNASVWNVPGNPYSSINANGVPGNPRYNSFTYSGDNTGLFIYSNTNIEAGTASLNSPFTFYMTKNQTVLGITTSPRNYAGQGAPPRLGGYLDYAYASPYNPTNQSLQEICWWSIGGGLSDGSVGGPIPLSQQPSFYNIIQKFQTTLGRAV